MLQDEILQRQKRLIGALVARNRAMNNVIATSVEFMKTHGYLDNEELGMMAVELAGITRLHTIEPDKEFFAFASADEDYSKFRTAEERREGDEKVLVSVMVGDRFKQIGVSNDSPVDDHR